ncbi:MAG: molybdopterin cofactor-binding domain-containing protein [Spirochaetia bacterium]
MENSLTKDPVDQGIKNYASYWGVGPVFLSQNYTNAQKIYLLKTSELGQFSYTIPQDCDECVFCEPIIKNFAIEAEYCSHPLFARGNSSYIGQPILAIIAKDIQEATQITSQIPIVYADEPTIAITLENFTQEDVLLETKLISENFDQVIRESSYETLRLDYTIPEQISQQNCQYGAYAIMEGSEKIRVYVTSDWPTHVHENLVDCLGLKPENIILTPLHHAGVENNMLIEPTFWACYVAIATWKTKKPTKIIFPDITGIQLAHSAPAAISINLGIDPQTMSISYTIDAVLSAGYYGYLMDELAERILSSFFQFYQPKIYHIRIRSIITNEPPRGPFLSLASSYIQSLVSLTLGFLANRHTSPLALIYTQILCHDPHLSCILDRHFIQLNQITDFKRKALAYQMQAKHQAKNLLLNENPISLRLRGISYASAIGLGGFILPQYQRLSTTAILKDNGDLAIYIPQLLYQEKNIPIWIDLIAEHLKIDKEKILIYPDFQLKIGPYIPGLSMTMMGPLLKKVAYELQKNRELADIEYPIKVALSYENYAHLQETDDIELSSNLNGKKHSVLTCAVELYVDPVSLEIRIEDLTFILSCGAVIDYNAMYAHITKTVQQVLEWLNPHLKPLSIPSFKLFIDEDSALPYPLAINAIVESTLTAAYLGALSQSINTPLVTFPYNSQMIFEILKIKVVEPG